MLFKPPKTLSEYVANRAQLLEQITRFLEKDERFVAAWLTGSFGRDDADEVSDLDLTVLVDDVFAETLCARPYQVGAGTIKARYALFSQFGQPHIVHDNHNNAPPDGSFTFVLYQETALVVDWILRPCADVTRPTLSRLLFDKIGVAVEPPPSVESLEKRIEMASEQVAFFWLMVTVTIKYLIRRDDIYAHHFLDWLHGILRSVRRLVAGEPDRWIRGAQAKMSVTREDQITAVRQICQEMLNVMPDVQRMGGSVPDSPMDTMETLLLLAKGK
ncbi:MAG: nucleotidyltransferase domain-containing protein [Chloroflexi bacterium]|nr:nucleotidyltransferase domain-containing protein [Chloroflexota bacterium]